MNTVKIGKTDFTTGKRTSEAQVYRKLVLLCRPRYARIILKTDLGEILFRIKGSVLE
jgi:hypothetical protein